MGRDDSSAGLEANRMANDALFKGAAEGCAGGGPERRRVHPGAYPGNGKSFIRRKSVSCGEKSAGGPA